MAALAIVACPCHLPLLLVLLGGTALGAVLSEHMAIAFITFTALFVLSAWAALRTFSHSGPAGRVARRARTAQVTGATQEPGGRA
jgi:mercuric ion transport protein